MRLRDLGYKQQALYCYGKVYQLEPDNADSLWDRACLAKEMGEFRVVRMSTAINALCLLILRTSFRHAIH